MLPNTPTVYGHLHFVGGELTAHAFNTADGPLVTINAGYRVHVSFGTEHLPALRDAVRLLEEYAKEQKERPVP